jgi:CubicO group peptidase (beta-lactamase class C family)
MTQPDPDLARLDRVALAMFDQQRALAEVPRMAGGVVRDGALVSTYGYAATDHSLFRIASMSKSFTASAVLMLRDSGALALDDPLARHVPEFASLRGPTTDSPAITIRHLLTMSSALATDDPWGDRHLDISDSDLDAVVQGAPQFAASPGTQFEYSNLGYGILGRVIHRVSGQRPQAFITERVLRPLGMYQTVWQADQAPAGTDVVIGVREDRRTPEVPLLDGGLATMGGLWSTVSDLARWIGFFTDAYPERNDADDLPLRRSSRREMQQIWTAHDAQSHLGLDGVRRTVAGGYGMGLLIGHDDELGATAGHAGGLPGYGSNMRWIRGGPLGVIALANVTYSPMTGTTRRVLDALIAAGIARRPGVVAASGLATAGSALAALLMSWSDAAAFALFADNVEPDESLEVRRTAAEALVARCGSLRVARIEPESRTSGVVVLQHATGEVAVDFQLSPSAPGRIQYYSFD